MTSERSFFSSGHLVAQGRHTAIESFDYIEAEVQQKPLPRWREFLRTGIWLYFYDSGVNRVEVNYKIGSYTECCAGGYCPQHYEYLAGDFEVWWPNGHQLARGRLIPTSIHRDTNCEGGDTVFHGVPSADTKYWAPDGSPGDSSLLEKAGVLLDEL